MQHDFGRCVMVISSFKIVRSTFYQFFLGKSASSHSRRTPRAHADFRALSSLSRPRDRHLPRVGEHACSRSRPSVHRGVSRQLRGRPFRPQLENPSDPRLPRSSRIRDDHDSITFAQRWMEGRAACLSPEVELARESSVHDCAQLLVRVTRDVRDQYFLPYRCIRADVSSKPRVDRSSSHKLTLLAKCTGGFTRAIHERALSSSAPIYCTIEG